MSHVRQICLWAAVPARRQGKVEQNWAQNSENLHCIARCTGELHCRRCTGVFPSRQCNSTPARGIFHTLVMWRCSNMYATQTICSCLRACSSLLCSGRMMGILYNKIPSRFSTPASNSSNKPLSRLSTMPHHNSSSTPRALQAQV